MRRDAWQALADPTRREIITTLSDGSKTINKIAEKFQVSRPAISKHIKILEESSLLVIHKNGRERICHLTLEPLQEVYTWVKEYEQFWLKRLDRLEDYLDKE